MVGFLATIFFFSCARNACLNVDITRAFDSVNWYGLVFTMVFMGFDKTFINWVMKSVTTPSYSVLVMVPLSSMDLQI